MSANTKIEWADHTLNPWIGCTKVSPGCDLCYAKAEWDDRRHRAVWGPGQARSRTKTWGDPVKWAKQHEAFYANHGRRQRVFCASLADVFDNEVPTEWRHDLFNLIKDTPELDWLLLTKRPQNIVRMVQDHGCVAGNGMRYLPINVWLGTSTEDQKRADTNIAALLDAKEKTGAKIAFLSMEPLLGPVDLTPFLWGKHERVDTICQNCPRDADCECGYHTRAELKLPAIDWVIVGGESGHNARPMHPEWARGLRDQCHAAGVPFLFKQWGEWAPPATRDDLRFLGDMMRAGKAVHVYGDGREPDGHFRRGDEHLLRVGKKAAGRQLDGRTWDEVPA